ncbi:hypothetical protein BJ170DRAFT_682007 [Xylariales sp. AK1849]|nr:hypothetical protein BJ170DRAFT_682007 [Xylariales sp. AK1849]
MSSRPARSNQPPPPASNRQNEYFVPRDGIDREVITADICRYLGNDALVRPGVYESPQTAQVVQGYFITAYRNLTTAMIEDLKADSSRWDAERRQQTGRNPVGGTIASRNVNGVFMQKSNSPVVQYRNSDTHQSRQYYGPTEGANPQDHARDSYDATPRYPGTGNAGYQGASGSPYPAQSYGNQGGYGGQQGYTTVQQSQHFPPSPAEVSYSGGASMAGSGFGQPERPYTGVNANMAVRGGDTPMYGTDAYPRDNRIPVTSMSQGRPTYVTSGPPAQQGFAVTSSGAGYYPQQNAASASAGFAAVQPQDPFYGRASPAGNPAAYSAHDQQYETTPVPRSSAPPSNTQMATSGPSSRRERESVDRHTDSRHRSHRNGR